MVPRWMHPGGPSHPPYLHTRLMRRPFCRAPRRCRTRPGRPATRCTGLTSCRGTGRSQLTWKAPSPGMCHQRHMPLTRDVPEQGRARGVLRRSAHMAPGRCLRRSFASRVPPEVSGSLHIGEAGESAPTGRGQGDSNGQAAFPCARASPRTTRSLRGSGPDGGRRPPACCVPARGGPPGTTVPGAGACRGDSR